MERTVETLEQELKSEHDHYLRALADFENYRRRIARERDQLGKEALREFMVSLLDEVDDIERLLAFARDDDSPVVQGVRAIHEKLLQLLEKYGVRPIESVGKGFDPALHEAVNTVPAGEKEPGTIVEEVRRGYVWNDELLRTAQVVVAM